MTTNNPNQLNPEIDRLKALARTQVELPSQDMLYQSGPFPSVQQFFDSAFQNFRELLFYTNIHPQMRLLDYGCGLGRLGIPTSVFLDETKGSYCGVDTDANCIRRNREIFASYPHFEFHHADIFSKMYNNSGESMASVLPQLKLGEEFDLAFLFSVFTHVLPGDCDFLLEYLYARLKTDREIFASFFLLNNATRDAIKSGQAHRQFATPYGNAWIDNADVPEGAVAYEEDDAIDRFQQAGFTDIRIYPGKWRGPIDSFVWQDIIVARKTDK